MTLKEKYYICISVLIIINLVLLAISIVLDNPYFASPIPVCVFLFGVVSYLKLRCKNCGEFYLFEIRNGIFRHLPFPDRCRKCGNKLDG